MVIKVEKKFWMPNEEHTVISGNYFPSTESVSAFVKEMLLFFESR